MKKKKSLFLSCIWLFVTLWTVAGQVPLPMGFPRQEYWSGLPFPSPAHESEKRKWSRSVVPDSWLLATSWPAAHQVPLPMGFPRQEYWSGVPLTHTILCKRWNFIILAMCSVNFNTNWNFSIWMKGHVEAIFSIRKSVNPRLISSVQFSCSVVSGSLQPHESQHARPPCLPGATMGDSTHDKGHVKENC